MSLKVFDVVQFQTKGYLHFFGDRQLTGVTSYVNQYKLPFDKDSVSKNKAAQLTEELGRTITQTEVLAGWNKKAQNGRALGKAVHAEIASVLSEAAGFQSMSPQLGMFDLESTEWPQVVAWRNWWREKGETKLYPVAVEQSIFDPDFNIAGTFDSLFSFTSRPDMYALIDWKTGNFNTVPYNDDDTMLPPYDDLPNCELTFYSLQLSLYNIILKRMAEIDVHKTYIGHITEKRVDMHEVVDYRERLLKELLS